MYMFVIHCIQVPSKDVPSKDIPSLLRSSTWPKMAASTTVTDKKVNIITMEPPGKGCFVCGQPFCPLGYPYLEVENIY